MIIQPMHTSTSDLPNVSAELASTLSGVAELAHLGVIRAKGEDAAKFLQGQLTQDVAGMGPDQAHLAAFCNAKGRMQASFVVFKRVPDEILMVCSRDLLAQTLKRLSMFVMRAKVKLDDATADFTLLGLTGSAIESIAGGALNPGATTTIDGVKLVFLHLGARQARALWCAPAGTPWPQGTRLAPPIWAWLEVQSGIAMITMPIFEAFVPQMLNYESTGGVNFKKGCYPGQEVVARSQFRGTLKRRAYLVHATSAMEPGQSLFVPDYAEQPVATVVQAAPAPGGGFDAIISGQTSAIDAGVLHLGDSNGPQLAVLPLPYALLDDM